MKTKLGGKFWAALVIFSLTGQIAWVIENMYFNVFIYKMFNADAGSISLMVAASSIAATLTTLFIGALSDKLGKRKIFMCMGYILWGISVWSFALLRTDVIGSLFPMAASAAAVGVSLTIIMDCVMTFFGSSANDACFNAWLTDSTDDTNRGSAEGINAMMPLLAMLAVFGGFMSFDLGDPQSWVTIFTVIGVAVTAIGILGFFIIKEPMIDTKENNSFFGNIFYGFRPSVVKSNARLYVCLLAFAVFGISIQIFMPYLILYYNVSLGMENYVLIMAPAVIIAAVFTAFYGRVYDKRGFIFSCSPAIALLLGGYLIMYLFKTTVPVFIGSLLLMCGYLAGTAVFGAAIRDNTPANRSGMFQGLRIVSQVLIPGIIGPAIGAKVLANAEMIPNDDGTFSFKPNENIYLAAFIAGIALVVLLIAAVYPMLKKEGKRNEAK